MRHLSTLHERYIEVFLPDDLPGEAYENALYELKKFIAEQYPESCYIKHSNWNCNIILSQNGAPSLESKLTFIHDIWSAEASKNEWREWRVRVEKQRLVINYCKNRIDDPGSFAEFLIFSEPIITFFQHKLGIKSYPNIKLNYLFKYDFNTIANKDLCTEKLIEVKDIFKPFAATRNDAPDDFEVFVPPYHWEQTWRLEQDFFLRSTLNTSKQNETFALFMTLTAWQENEIASPLSLLSELFKKLEVIYHAMLTEKAKNHLKDDWK